MSDLNYNYYDVENTNSLSDISDLHSHSDFYDLESQSQRDKLMANTEIDKQANSDIENKLTSDIVEGALRSISTLIPVQNLRNVTEKSVDNVLESDSNSKLSDTPVKLIRKCLQNLFPAPYVVMSNKSGKNCSKSGSDAKMNSTCDD